MGQDSQIEADYFGLAAAWDEELYGQLKKQRKIAFIVAAVSMGIAAMAVGAVMMLTPLKEIEPYLVVVDKTTGYSQAVRKMNIAEGTPLTETESVVMAEINDYVIARETFDPQDIDRRRLALRMTTLGEEYKRYERELFAEVESMHRNALRTVTIKSIIPQIDKSTNSGTAQVRFSTTTENMNNLNTEHWIATLTYEFRDLDMEIKYRFLNPLGFLIKSYRVDPESGN